MLAIASLDGRFDNSVELYAGLLECDASPYFPSIRRNLREQIARLQPEKNGFWQCSCRIAARKIVEDDRWFVGRGTVQKGPYSFGTLKRAVLKSKIRRDDLVWKEGFSDWVLADLVPNLFPPASDNAEGSAKFEPTSTATASASEPGAVDPLAAQKSVAPAESRSARRPNYIVRHWRGNLSLAVSYWINGTLVTISIVLLFTAFDQWKLADRFGLYGTAIWILGQLGFTAAVTLWQFVGTWRSAEKHVSRGGSAGWATAAKVAIVLGALRAVGTFTTELPLFEQSLTMLAGREDIPHYQIRVLRNATELEVSGGLSFGTTDAVATILDATPTAKLIHLNNSGGWISEGSKLGDLIEARGLATYTARSCVSACVMAFISGKERYLASTARLGFHSASVAGVDGKVAEAGNDRQREVLTRHGVNSDFVNHAFSTRASDMWYPTNAELLSAHVISAVVDDRDYAMTNTGDWQDSAKADAQLAEVPAYAAMKRRDPIEYEKLKKELVSGLQAGDSQRELNAKIRAHFQKLIPKYVLSGPDVELVAYWSTQIDEIGQLQVANPVECVKFLFPDPARPPDIERLVSKDVQNADMRALGALIDADSTVPLPTLTKAQLAPILRELSTSIERIHPGTTKVVASPEGAKDNPARLCNAELVFYRALMSLPSNQSGPILRSFNSQ